MKAKKFLKSAAIFLAVVIATYVFLKKNSTLVRPYYPPESILMNPAGTCALTEYKFKGGERWYWLDPYSWFVMADGDAFYTITDIRTGKIIRDSTASIPAINSISRGWAGMGDSVFYWSNNGKTAAFPGGEGPYHEWTDIQECEGTKTKSEFSDLECNSDNRSSVCDKLRSALQR